MAQMKKIKLKPNKEIPVLRGHPWIYKEAIQEPLPSIEIGDEVIILDSKGNILGSGYADPTSNILVRVVSGKTSNNVSVKDKIVNNILLSVDLRKNFFDENITNAYRVVNGEGDGIPALIVDKYDTALVIQFYSVALEKYLDSIVSTLLKAFPNTNWIWKRDHVRKVTTKINGLIYGKHLPDTINIKENNLNFRVNIIQGHKTGFYLDQRDNREIIRKLSYNKTVANLCGYTGAFTVYATAGKAKHVITLDISQPALEETVYNLQINNFSLSNQTFVTADIFDIENMKITLSNSLKSKLDLIILDPPALAHNKKQINSALKAYKKINTFALKTLQNGGILFTSSCTAYIDRNKFLQIITESANKANKKLKLLFESHQPIDHPVNLAHPEGRYLKALLLEVID